MVRSATARLDHEMNDQTACFVSLSFAGLVVLARSMNPIPSRTRPLNSSAPMVLWLKPWESRSLPGLPKTKQFLFTCHDQTKRRLPREAAFLFVRAATPPIFDRRSTATSLPARSATVHCDDTMILRVTGTITVE